MCARRRRAYRSCTGSCTIPASGDVRTWTVTLFPAPGLEGRIRAAAGSSLPDLSVHALPHGDGPVRTTRVDPGGVFAFPGLGSDPVDLQVTRANVRSDLVLARVEGLIPGRSPPVLITLPRLAAIEGRVKDAADAGPAVRVLLEAPVFESDDDAFRWRTVTSVTIADDDPRRGFRIDGLSPGTYAVRAVQGDNDSGAHTVRLEESVTEHLELYLTPGGRVAGTVVDDRARPRLGAEVRLVRLRGDGDAPGRPAGAPRRATDAAGGYVFEDVAPGVWRVEVRDAGDAAEQETFRVAEGESVIVRDLVVGPGGAITGLVSDGWGRELDGALLVLEPLVEGPDARSARTGRAGLFRVDGLRPGSWRVRLDARAGPFTGLEALVEVVADETVEVELTATGRARVLGRVWRQGRPVPDLAVYLVSRPGGVAGIARRLDDPVRRGGALRLRGPADRRLRGGRRGRGRLVDTPDPVDDGDVLTLDLEAWEGRLVGEVLGPGGAPIANATVLARTWGPGAEALVGRVRTDPQGRFHIVGLPVGRLRPRGLRPRTPPGPVARRDRRGGGRRAPGDADARRGRHARAARSSGRPAAASRRRGLAGGRAGRRAPRAPLRDRVPGRLVLAARPGPPVDPRVGPRLRSPGAHGRERRGGRDERRRRPPRASGAARRAGRCAGIGGSRRARGSSSCASRAANPCSARTR